MMAALRLLTASAGLTCPCSPMSNDEKLPAKLATVWNHYITASLSITAPTIHIIHIIHTIHIYSHHSHRSHHSHHSRLGTKKNAVALAVLCHWIWRIWKARRVLESTTFARSPAGKCTEPESRRPGVKDAAQNNQDRMCLHMCIHVYIYIYIYICIYIIYIHVWYYVYYTFWNTSELENGTTCLLLMQERSAVPEANGSSH